MSRMKVSLALAAKFGLVIARGNLPPGAGQASTSGLPEGQPQRRVFGARHLGVVVATILLLEAILLLASSWHLSRNAWAAASLATSSTPGTP